MVDFYPKKLPGGLRGIETILFFETPLQIKILSMKMQDKNERLGCFRTSNFYTAVFLLVKGQKLVDIERLPNSKRSLFVFLEAPNREKLIKDFSFASQNSPEVMVDARQFATAIKSLKDKLYQNRVGYDEPC